MPEYRFRYSGIVHNKKLLLQKMLSFIKFQKYNNKFLTKK